MGACGRLQLVAGAGLSGASAELCADAACTKKVITPADVVSWEQSVQLVLPLSISPPLFLKVSEASGPLTASAPLTIPLNAPEIWWAMSGLPGTMQNGSFQLDPMHPSWINTSVTLGDPVRVFGRSLGWDGSDCLSAAPKPAAVPSTKLSVAGIVSPASSANCFEATFPTDGMVAGEHEATLSTPWGSASFGLTVLAQVQPPPATTIDVTKDFAGDLMKAVAHIATLPMSTPKIVTLGRTTYKLNSGLIIPVNTTIIGAGSASSAIEFAIQAPTAAGGT